MRPRLETPTTLPGLDSLLGMRLVHADPDRVEVRVSVRPELLQPWGILHGGVHCAAVETAASVAATAWIEQRHPQARVVGVSNQTDFYRAVTDGELSAVATPVHRGRSQQVWQVAVTDAADRLVARGQVRLHNLHESPPATG